MWYMQKLWSSKEAASGLNKRPWKQVIAVKKPRKQKTPTYQKHIETQIFSIRSN
jgi:hypothetical protein